MSTCEDMPKEAWIQHRFSGSCYWYPMRDCPGWEPGGLCGRIQRRIPADAEPDDAVRA